MGELVALIIGVLATSTTLQAGTGLSDVVKVANEVGAGEMVGFIRSTGVEEVTVDDENCLSVINQFTPTIWESMQLGEAGELKSVDVTSDGVTYNFEDGTSVSFEFDALLNMLK